MSRPGQLGESLAHGMVEWKPTDTRRSRRIMERRPTFGRVFPEHAHHRIGKGRRALRPRDAEFGWRVHELHFHQLLDRVGVERRLTRQHLVRHDAEGVLVRKLRRLTGPLLGAHVFWRSDGCPGARQSDCAPNLRDAEVCDDGETLGVDDDVRRFDITVRDVLGVGVIQRAGDIEIDCLRQLDRQRRGFRHDGLQGASLDIVHREKQELAGFLEAEDRRNVSVAKGRGDARFPPESLEQGSGLAGGPRREQARIHYLDRNLAVQRDLMGEVHYTHATATQFAHDVVLAKGDGLEIHQQGRLRCIGQDLPAPRAEAVARDELASAVGTGRDCIGRGGSRCVGVHRHRQTRATHARAILVALPE